MIDYERQAITSTARLPRHPGIEGGLPKVETPEKRSDELRDFLIVLRRALLMVSGYIEQRYMR